MEKTAEILTKRSRRLGHYQTLFVVSDENKIVGKIPKDVDLKEFVRVISQIGLVEFVDFGNNPPLGISIVNTDINNAILIEPESKEWHTILTNEAILDASVYKDSTGEFQVAFTLSENGTTLFKEFTSSNIGSYLGIVLDKAIISLPVINEPILDGRSVITGNFTKEGAEGLALILQNEPLPIPIKALGE